MKGAWPSGYAPFIIFIGGSMIYKKLIFILLISFFFIALTSCVVDEDEETLIDTPHMGVYILQERTIDSFNETEQYVFSTLELIDNKAIFTELDIFGLQIQEGTFVISGTSINISLGLRQLTFDFSEDDRSLTYQGTMSRKEVFMRYHKTDGFIKPETFGESAYNEQLFGESLDENYYNYAPAIVMEGNNTMHVWFCGNGESGNVTDYIVYRKGTLQADGKWSFTERELVLASTEGTWDQRHVCDPTVIIGEFKYQNEDYLYLMSYLGCVTNDSSRNEVGIAVAKSIEGPWTKVESLNPIANYYESGEYVDNQWTWGYGQPSLVSVDKKGKILLFYTKGIMNGTFQHVEYWDLSNLDDPKKLHEASITNAGVVNQSGGIDVINNADFAYDPFMKRLYVVKEDFPYKDEGGTNWLTGANTVMYLNLNHDETFIGETLFLDQPLRWQVIGSVGTNETGFKRVHNSGLVRDEFGYLINPFQIPLIYTRSDESIDHPDWELGGQWPALHTYRLYGYLIEL